MSRNKEDRPNGAAAEGGRPIGGAAEGGASVFFVSAHLSFYIMHIYGCSLYIPYISHIYVLNIFHIFVLACFLISGVKSSFGHEQMMSVGQSSHISVPKLNF